MNEVSQSHNLTLAGLLEPMAHDEFFGKFRGRRPAFVKGEKDRFGFAMSWELISEILNQSAIWSPNSLQVFLDAAAVPAQQYCYAGVNRDGQQAMMVDFARLKEWIAKGAALVLNDVETLTPGMKSISRALENDPGGKVQANIYCSWRAHQAFPPHFDTHEVFAFQIEGKKRWNIYKRHFKDPINHPVFKQLDAAFHEEHKGEKQNEFLMEPGDLLYIPRGYYHDALAESEGSIHIAFSVISPIGLDLISALFEHAVDDEFFRQAIPHPDAEDGKLTEEHINRLAGRLREMCRDAEFAERFKQSLRTFQFQRGAIKLPDDAL